MYESVDFSGTTGFLPKSDEYAKLLFDMDTAGVATPPQILASDGSFSTSRQINPF
jgi:hypothetical protein